MKCHRPVCRNEAEPAFVSLNGIIVPLCPQCHHELINWLNGRQGFQISTPGTTDINQILAIFNQQLISLTQRQQHLPSLEVFNNLRERIESIEAYLELTEQVKPKSKDV